MAGEEAEWTDRDGRYRVGRNQLTQSKERELRQHIWTCEKPLRKCAGCWLLYRNIGEDAWNEEVTRALVAFGYLDPEETDLL